MVPNSVILFSGGPEETDSLGRLIASRLQPGDVVSLDGDLGAGKTALTRGIAAGLRCRIPVSSPTFTLLIEHPAVAGGLALYHFDVYRLTGSADFTGIGLDEYFDLGGVCVVEWGALIGEVLPAGTLHIRLFQADPDQPALRRLEISWPDRPQRLAELARLLAKQEEGEPC